MDNRDHFRNGSEHERGYHQENRSANRSGFGERSESSHYTGKPTGNRSGYGEHSESSHYTGKPSGNRGSYGGRSESSHYTGKPAGNRSSFGERSESSHYTGKPAGNRSSYGEHSESSHYTGKPAGNRSGYGERSESSHYTGKPAGNRSGYGERSESSHFPGKPFENRPNPQKPPFGERPAGMIRDGRIAYGSNRVVPQAVKPVPQPVAVQDVSPARRIAFMVLVDVKRNNAFANLSLNSHFTDNYLSPEDKRLATALVYGVLENRLKLDMILAQFMEHPAVDDFATEILRMGAYQILMMDRIPENAAVNEAVNQAKRSCPASSGMINGVLRNLCRGKGSIQYPIEEENPTYYLSVMSSTPQWLVELLIESYGYEEARALLLYREEEHPLVLRPNMSQLTDYEFEQLLAKKVWRCRKGLAPHSYLVTGASAISCDRDYLAGHFSIEGQSSILAAEALQVRPGMKVLDACAAPGGKSAYLCEQMQLTGRVYAWELYEKRAALIESVKRRLKLENLRITVRDASYFRSEDEANFDAVLLDAPCSGLGVIAQKPDIKYNITEEGISDIVEIQKRLLDTVCRYVKKGGSFVYSTCSILPEENILQIQRFLEEHPEFETVPLPASVPAELSEKQTEYGLQLLPHRDGVEGFFIAKMRRKAY